MNKKFLIVVLVAVLVGFALGITGRGFAGPAATSPQVAYAAQPGDGGGPMGPDGPGMGGPGMGGMRMMGGPGMGMGGPPMFPMTSNASYVFILIGNNLYKYDAKTLKLVAKTQIELPSPPPGMGGPNMGGPNNGPPGGQ